MEKESSMFVKWKVYVWTIGIILILFGTCFTQINKNSSKLDAYNKDFTDIKIQLSAIQTDLLWIKTNLK